MDITKIKPIPKYILAAINKKDKCCYPSPCGSTRFYAYLAIWNKELVKVTVAVKQKNRKWYCKQVAVHGIHSEKCFVKDIEYCYITGMGFRVGWYEQGLQPFRKWFEDGKWYQANDNGYDPYALIVNPSLVYKFPEYKYSAYNIYKGVDVLQYLRIYEQYPQVEYLVKLGFNLYVHSKQLLRATTNNKAFCNWLIKNRKEIIARKYYISTILTAYSSKRPLEEVQAFEQKKKELICNKSLKHLREVFKNELESFFSYIEKQKTHLHSYKDYLEACEELGVDMNEPKNRYPHDFKRWHDIRIDEYASKKAAMDAEKRKEFYADFANIAKKYLPLQRQLKEGFVCIIAKSPAELVKEGKALSHCVGGMGYDQKFVREETLIFFIRLADEREKPFVTVEYSLSEHKVLQCYGKGDSKPDEKVLDFVHNKWLPYANRKIKKIAA